MPAGVTHRQYPPWFQHGGLFVSFILCGELGSEPFVPASLEGVDRDVSFLHKLPCHPGTGPFIRSGTVEDKSFVPRILVDPGTDLTRLLSDRALNLHGAGLPVRI